MAGGAGEYRDRLHWEQRAPGAKDAAGQRTDAFADAGYLWGRLQDLAGSRQGAKESERGGATGTARLRGFPAVKPGDRLTDGWGRVWTVENAVAQRPDNETECEITRPKWTAGGGTTGGAAP